VAAQYTPEKIGKLLRKLGQNITQEVMKAEQANARDVKRMAEKLSSGTFIPAKAVKWAFPYAKRDPHPPGGRADIINMRTKVFVRSWVILGPMSDRKTGAMVTKVRNIAPYAPFMWSGDQSTMIERPIISTIEQDIERSRRRRLEDAVQKALDKAK
jgi:hypothetical protein